MSPAAARVRGPRPESVTVTMYQVGFGDCFLVSFKYARPLADGRAERHMLIDFGSTHRPRGSSSNGTPVLETAVAEIERHTNGRLDVVVVTHRHRDHLSGFGDAKAAKRIAALRPRLVVRPWTEEPTLPRDATAPAGAGGGDGAGRSAAGVRRAGAAAAPDDRLGFAQRLVDGIQLSAEVARLADGAVQLAGARADSTAGRLAQLAADQVPNPKAIAFLDELAQATGGGEYLSAGDATRIEQLIPGIRVRTLGPPTVKQFGAILGQRADDPDEFWLAQLGEIRGLTPAQLDMSRRAKPPDVEPGPVAWLVRQLTDQHAGSLLRIVRTVDDALNNTSLILLIEAGDKRLLFPGDAQIENWSWALSAAPDAAATRRLLAGVDLYKVGHHGSRNATPRQSLFDLWSKTTPAQHPMVALMSTAAGVHGRSDETAVPRSTLVEALSRRMTLVSTDAFDKRTLFTVVTAPCSGGQPFRELPAAPAPLR